MIDLEEKFPCSWCGILIDSYESISGECLLCSVGATVKDREEFINKHKGEPGIPDR